MRPHERCLVLLVDDHVAKALSMGLASWNALPAAALCLEPPDTKHSADDLWRTGAVLGAAHPQHALVECLYASRALSDKKYYVRRTACSALSHMSNAP